jgi:hypothetical protein
MPIDDEEDDDDYYYYNDSTITETKKMYMPNNDEFNSIPRKSLERVDNIPFNVKMERYSGNTKLDTIKLPASTIAQPIRVAMKPIPKNIDNNNKATITTINRSKPWRSDTSLTNDDNSISSFTIIDSGTTTSTIEPTVMGRVMQPVSNSSLATTTTTTITTTVTTTVRP